MKYYIKIKWFGVLALIALITGCNTDEALFRKDASPLGVKSKGMETLLEISYEKTTYVDYEYDFESMTELDLAHINPSEDKQRIEMVLLADGTVNMTIEQMKFERNIKIPHQTLPNDMPGVHKTVVMGNTVSLYDINGNLIGVQQMEMPKKIELAEQVKKMGAQYSDEEIAQVLSGMHGSHFEQNFEKMIAEAKAKGQLTEHGEQYVSIRVNFSDIKPGAKGAGVMLVNKDSKKKVASITYNEKDEAIHRMYYGYEKEGTPIQSATRSELLVKVPSNNEVWKVTSSKIENFKFKINTFKK